jgi:hypothetical protein
MGFLSGLFRGSPYEGVTECRDCGNFLTEDEIYRNRGLCFDCIEKRDNGRRSYDDSYNDNDSSNQDEEY